MHCDKNQSASNTNCFQIEGFQLILKFYSVFSSDVFSFPTSALIRRNYVAEDQRVCRKSSGRARRICIA